MFLTFVCVRSAGLGDQGHFTVSGSPAEPLKPKDDVSAAHTMPSQSFGTEVGPV